MTWISHLNFLGNKISKIIMRLLQIITYACNIGYNTKVKFLTKLQSIQRTSLITITKCYKTVATDTLCVLAGCLPFHLLIEKQIDYENKVIINSNINILNLNKRIKLNYMLQNKLYYNIKTNTELGTNEFYTDGSKLNDSVGCAYVY